MLFRSTLCNEEVCPSIVTKGKRLHWPIPDPAAALEADKPPAFRAARNDIEEKLRSFGRELGLL